MPLGALDTLSLTSHISSIFPKTPNPSLNWSSVICLPQTMNSLELGGSSYLVPPGAPEVEFELLRPCIWSSLSWWWWCMSCLEVCRGEAAEAVGVERLESEDIRSFVPLYLCLCPHSVSSLCSFVSLKSVNALTEKGPWVECVISVFFLFSLVHFTPQPVVPPFQLSKTSLWKWQANFQCLHQTKSTAEMICERVCSSPVQTRRSPGLFFNACDAVWLHIVLGVSLHFTDIHS